MATIKMQHTVADFDGWKKMFDSDPLDRKGNGVLAYRVTRGVADPNLVMVDLEFGDADAAKAFLVRLEALWAGPANAVLSEARGWVVEEVESSQT